MSVIERPTLTLPKAEAAWITQAYSDASAILEYGSGGSTVMAAEMSGKTVFSVESDRHWAAMMSEYFDANPSASPVNMHWADIGPTVAWGSPKNTKNHQKFSRYPLNVWDRDDFVHPDTVLIDGRFRQGCLLAVLFRATKPVTVYFDDYMNRKTYHQIEEFVPRVDYIGRMARFEVTPRDIKPAELGRITEIMGNPR